MFSYNFKRYYFKKIFYDCCGEINLILLDIGWVYWKVSDLGFY